MHTAKQKQQCEYFEIETVATSQLWILKKKYDYQARSGKYRTTEFDRGEWEGQKWNDDRISQPLKGIAFIILIIRNSNTKIAISSSPTAVSGDGLGKVPAR